MDYSMSELQYVSYYINDTGWSVGFKFLTDKDMWTASFCIIFYGHVSMQYS